MIKNRDRVTKGVVEDEIKQLSTSLFPYIIWITNSYELAENAIFIKQPLTEFDRKKITKPIGWIFRRNLDYVSLDFINGDWRRKFLWSCEITSSRELETRLKNKLNKLIRLREKKH